MLQKIKNRRSQAGFTLVELLIVIVVIAILAAIAITAFAGVQARARDTQRQADIDQIKSQLELYYTDNGKYPTEAQMTGAPGSVTSLLDGLDPETLVDPQTQDTDGNSFAATDNPSSGTYGYKAATKDSGGTTCDNTSSSKDCKSYTLYYYKETKDGGAGVVSVKDVSGE